MGKRTVDNAKTSYNIAIFSNSVFSGGAEKQALLLAKNLKAQHQVVLIAYYSKYKDIKAENIIKAFDLEVIELQGSHLHKSAQLFRILRQRNIDMIFSYLLTTNLLGAVVGKLAGVEYCIGGIRNAVLSKYKLGLQRFIQNKLTDYTIYNNYRGVSDFSKVGFNKNKAIVIPNCLDNIPEPIKRKPSSTTYILSVGRFNHQKGFDVALRTINQLVKKGLRIKYLLVGYGLLERELRNQIDQLNLQEHVKVSLNPPNLEDLYSKADIYLCSSRFEGLSNTIMEAMSYSLPIVATNVGDNDYLVADGENGFLVADALPDLLAEPVECLVKSEDLRASFGRASLQMVQNNFNEKIFLQRYLSFIHQLYTAQNLDSGK